MSDYYSTLGVSRDADSEVIEAAYRALSKKLHPDRPGGDAERFSLVNAAHDVLRDPASRRDYDLTLSDATSEETDPEPTFDEASWGEEEVIQGDEYADTPVVDDFSPVSEHDQPAPSRSADDGLSLVGMGVLGAVALVTLILCFVAGGWAWGWAVLFAVNSVVLVRTHGSAIAIAAAVLVALLAYAVRSTDGVAVAAVVAAGALPVAAVAVSIFARERRTS